MTDASKPIISPFLYSTYTPFNDLFLRSIIARMMLNVNMLHGSKHSLTKPYFLNLQGEPELVGSNKWSRTWTKFEPNC